MATDSRRRLHDVVEHMSEEEAGRLDAALRRGGARSRVPRPLAESDILLPAPILPEDETADGMIAAIRQWRGEGGHG